MNELMPMVGGGEAGERHGMRRAAPCARERERDRCGARVEDAGHWLAAFRSRRKALAGPCRSASDCDLRRPGDELKSPRERARLG